MADPKGSILAETFVDVTREVIEPTCSWQRRGHLARTSYQLVATSHA